MIQVKAFPVNPLQENTYLVWDETREAIVIDAGFLMDNEKQRFESVLKENDLKLVKVINTHLHFDHQFGNRYLAEKFDLKPLAHKLDEHLLDDAKAGKIVYGFPIREDAQELGGYIEEGEMIKFGNTELLAIWVPGHTPGHLVFYDSQSGSLFAGDVLFRGSVGRTDFPGGDHASLITNIQKKLLVLPDDTVVYSGHGPTTTIAYEKQYNPYL